MNKKDYNREADDMVNEGIQQGQYKETDDNIFKKFESFLYQNFKNSPHRSQMPPSSLQAARFFATAKTHKLENINDITIDKLKLHPIIDQTGTCYYMTGKVIAEYLKPLTKNEFIITNTQQFLSMPNNVPLSEDEEDVGYDAESLFTNIPIKKKHY